jgi:DNA primase
LRYKGVININKIQEVKDRADIVKVAHYFGIKEKQCCPFHKEKTASFSISKSKQIFHCFGCNEGGDVITLVSKVLNVNAYESAKQINDIQGLGIDFGKTTSKLEIEKYQYQQHLKEEFKKWKDKAFNTLCNYYHYLVDNEIFEKTDIVDYWLEILREGTEEEQMQFYKYERKKVQELGRRFG